jgi:hypothetical protein
MKTKLLDISHQTSMFVAGVFQFMCCVMIRKPTAVPKPLIGTGSWSIAVYTVAGLLTLAAFVLTTRGCRHLYRFIVIPIIMAVQVLGGLAVAKYYNDSSLWIGVAGMIMFAMVAGAAITFLPPAKRKPWHEHLEL